MSALDDVVATFRRWLHIPEPGALYAVLGAVAANRMPGDPVWLLLVGPPGGGKSELLASIRGLPKVHAAATLTEAALLSGTPKKDTSTEARGGLLRAMGSFGIILAKDFGSVINMHTDKRGVLLAALREIYDGSWTRHVGSDGGRLLHWEGKVGFVGGCTPSIDRHQAVMGAMGERFIFYRLDVVDPMAQATWALSHVGAEVAMRAELAASVDALFAPLPAAMGAPQLRQEHHLRIASLATLATRCRSAVERDRYSREIELIPEPEAPGRLTLVLAMLFEGMRSIGVTEEQAWAVITKMALDSMPVLRHRLLRLLNSGGPEHTGVLADAVGYPAVTVRRSLEDLEAHGLLGRLRTDGPAGHTWSVTAFARRHFSTAFDPASASFPQNPLDGPPTYFPTPEHQSGFFGNDRSGDLTVDEAR